MKNIRRMVKLAGLKGVTSTLQALTTSLFKRNNSMADLILSPIPVRPCIKCGAADRNPKGVCNICNRVRASAWYALNAARAKVNGMSYRAANPEKHKAAVARAVEANLDKKRSRDADWRASNPERISAVCAAWAAANPEARRIYNQNRRAKKRANGGVLTKGLSAKLFKLQRGLCPCCKQPLGDNFHLDHIQPIALGGSNTDDNMQLLRQRCNNQKHAKHPVDFMQSRGYLL